MANEIKCPNCAHPIDVNEVFAAQMEDKYKTLMQSQKQQLAAEMNVKQQELEQQRKDFEEKKKKTNELFLERLEKEKKTIAEQLKAKVKQDYDQQMEAQKAELEEKGKVIQDLRTKEIEMERMKRSMAEEKKNWELEFEKKIAKERDEYEEQIIKRERERMAMQLKDKDQKIELQLKEREKVIEDMKKQLDEAKRKAEQGSMQLQGEVQELAIEEYLRNNFPFDEIDEIKKGARGGDCLQIVHDGANRDCGTIYYESKRTKDFQPAWIEKFKADMRVKGADIGVIVTQAMPKDMEIMGEKNGIWICTFEEFKGLCHVLRTTIIRIAQERTGQENKGDKMSFLYDYLTGSEFRMQVEGIVEGFRQMQEDLQREKNSMNRIWSQREKQLQKVILNTTGMYGSIKGIAGKAIGTIEYLELPEGEE